MEIRKYNKETDENLLMALIEREGEDWSCYYEKSVNYKYRLALENSITYVAYESDMICGYSRAINDCGFYIYICDLLVDNKCRGKGLGKRLLEEFYKDYSGLTVYVMSDVDEYYEKLGYKKEGSVFEVRNPRED